MALSYDFERVKTGIRTQMLSQNNSREDITQLARHRQSVDSEMIQDYSKELDLLNAPESR
jgi:hypothetical protein